MDFSFMTITFIDIGLLSISILGLWMLKRRGDRLEQALKTAESRYDSLQETYTHLEKKHDVLEQKHEALLQTHITLEQKHEALLQTHITLEQKHEALLQKYITLEQKHEALLQEHVALQEEFKIFQSTADRRYNMLQTESERQLKRLQEENNALHEASVRQAAVIEDLKEGLYELRGRYNELSERLLPMLNQVIELLSQKQ